MEPPTTNTNSKQTVVFSSSFPYSFSAPRSADLGGGSRGSDGGCDGGGATAAARATLLHLQKPLLWRGEVRGSLLGRRRDHHPVVLPLLNRDLVALSLVELAPQALEAVEADGHHAAVFHCDDALLGLVTPEKREILEKINEVKKLPFPSLVY